MALVRDEMLEADIVLSGSSTKALGHVGFLSAISHLGIKPKRVASNSGGSLVSALWLSGMSLEEISRVGMETDYESFVPMGWTAVLRLFAKGYLSTGEEYLKMLERLFGSKKMKDITVPFYVMTSDITNGKLEIITQETHPQMSLALAVYMSSCLPLAFKPIILDGVAYRDGGVYKDFPIDIWPDHPRWRIGHLIGKTKKIEAKKWWTLRDEAEMLANRVIDANVDAAFSAIPDKSRTLIIESDGFNISSLQFKIDESIRRALQDQGYANTLRSLDPFLLKSPVA